MNSPINKSSFRTGIQSVEIGVRVVEVFVASDGPLHLREVAKAADLGPSAAHRYLVSLVRSGLIIQLPDQRYDLGPLAVRLGFAGLGRIDSINVAVSALESFVVDTGMTAMLSVWSERGPLVVRWKQGINPVYTTIAVGSILPINTSATGLIFATWGASVATKLKGAEKAHRDEIRRAGYAEITGNLVPGLFAVSVPVLDGTGSLIAAITAVDAGSCIEAETRCALIAAAAKASASLGYGCKNEKV